MDTVLIAPDGSVRRGSDERVVDRDRAGGAAGDGIEPQDQFWSTAGASSAGKLTSYGVHRRRSW